jgi:hypothetical protein
MAKSASPSNRVMRLPRRITGNRTNDGIRLFVALSRKLIVLPAFIDALDNRAGAEKSEGGEEHHLREAHGNDPREAERRPTGEHERRRCDADENTDRHQ